MSMGVGSTEPTRSGGTGSAGAGAGKRETPLKRVAYYKGCLASLSAKDSTRRPRPSLRSSGWSSSSWSR